MRRLPFALPDFIRVAWVSDRAREVWEPRVRRLSRIWSAVEWLSVAAGLRPCAILRLSEQRLAHLEPRWRALSLDIARLSDAAAPLRVGLGSPPEVDELRAAWKHRAHDAIGALLGYPDCCREFFLATSIQRSFADPTWFMANGSSAEAGRVAVTVSLLAGGVVKSARHLRDEDSDPEDVLQHGCDRHEGGSPPIWNRVSGRGGYRNGLSIPHQSGSAGTRRRLSPGAREPAGLSSKELVSGAKR